MEVGDPITYAYWSVTGPPPHQLWRTWVIHVGATRLTIDRTMPTVALKDEGVVWIRGHHDEHSAEGVALLAAHALEWSRVA